jgi:hypothetical protein
MAGRVRSSRADPDDWFADVDPEAPLSWEEDGAPFIPQERPRVDAYPPARRREAPTLRLGTLLAGGAVLVAVLVVGGLALAGVFSGGGHETPAAQNTQPRVTTHAQSPTPAETPSPRATVPAPTSTLKPGDSGAQVKVLQRALKSLGYKVGAIDGDYGNTTEVAVTSFQRHEKLTADGVFGAKTLQALKSALKAAA